MITPSDCKLVIDFIAAVKQNNWTLNVKYDGIEIILDKYNHCLFRSVEKAMGYVFGYQDGFGAGRVDGYERRKNREPLSD